MARQFDGAGNQDLVAALLEAGGDRLDAAARVAQALCKAEEADLAAIPADLMDSALAGP